MALDPTKAADELREATWSKKLPVDPVTIARSLGIRVVESSLPKDVSGALIKEKGRDAVIIVDSNDSDNRKRFTVAHELGHFVDRSQNGQDAFECVDLRSGASSCGNDLSEVFANKFAAALLMPADAVRSAFKEHKYSIILAQLFGVSSEAMSYRLENLGLLNKTDTAAGA